MLMHYWFIESENSPRTDPILFWFNGGPGASYLFGLLVELGPLLLNQDSFNNPIYNQTKIPQLIYNPDGWTQFSNLLVIETPPPVGFSYCNPVGPTGDGYSCGSWNDSYTAKSNYGFLVNWYKAYPEFLINELYIVGESYAGVYVPTLVREIVQNPTAKINLKGFAVGDGCIGTEVLCGEKDGPYYIMEFMHGHGQFSNILYNTIISSCSEADLRNGNLNATCIALIDNMWNEIGGFFDYNLYDECFDLNIFKKNRKWWDKSPPSRSLRGAENDYPCPGSAMDVWVNRTDVRVAINVPVNSFFFSADNGNGMNYISTEPDLLPFYNEAITIYNLRVLVYNGDTDPGLNSFVTQDIYIPYLQAQGHQNKEWRPWTKDGKQQMAGYVTEFPKFSYLTIRGSGHMVPEFKPIAAKSFMSTWISNQEFPPYLPTSPRKTK
jgi:hypothetical protein